MHMYMPHTSSSAHFYSRGRSSTYEKGIHGAPLSLIHTHTHTRTPAHMHMHMPHTSRSGHVLQQRLPQYLRRRGYTGSGSAWHTDGLYTKITRAHTHRELMVQTHTRTHTHMCMYMPHTSSSALGLAPTFGLTLGSPAARSWLQDTVKRKLIDFAWNRRFFYLPGACLPVFG